VISSEVYLRLDRRSIQWVMEKYLSVAGNVLFGKDKC
jgi:hypothetical protein